MWFCFYVVGIEDITGENESICRGIFSIGMCSVEILKIGAIKDSLSD